MIKVSSKKIITSLLILCLMANIFGYLILFLQMRQQIRDEMLEEIKSNPSPEELFIVKEKKNSSKQSRLHWREEDEFELNGKLYDVVSRTETQDSVTYFCLNDEKEETLLSGFIKCSDSSLKGKFASGKFGKIQIALNVYFPVNKFDPDNSAYYCSSLKEADRDHYKSWIQHIPAPPPKVLI